LRSFFCYRPACRGTTCDELPKMHHLLLHAPAWL